MKSLGETIHKKWEKKSEMSRTDIAQERHER